MISVVSGVSAISSMALSKIIFIFWIIFIIDFVLLFDVFFLFFLFAELLLEGCQLLHKTRIRVNLNNGGDTFALLRLRCLMTFSTE